MGENGEERGSVPVLLPLINIETGKQKKSRRDKKTKAK